MDLTGNKQENQAENDQMQAQREKQIKQFEQMYENATLMVDGEPEEIEDANLTQDGIELNTANHQYQIVMEG